MIGDIGTHFSRSEIMEKKTFKRIFIASQKNINGIIKNSDNSNFSCHLF